MHFNLRCEQCLINAFQFEIFHIVGGIGASDMKYCVGCLHRLKMKKKSKAFSRLKKSYDKFASREHEE